MGGNPFYFIFCSFFYFFDFLGDVTSVTTPLYIFVLVFLVPRIASKERKTNLWVCCPETDFCSSQFENPKNHITSSVAENNLQQESWFFLPFSSFKFFYLKSKSVPKISSLLSVLFFTDSVLSFALLLLRAK